MGQPLRFQDLFPNFTTKYLTIQFKIILQHHLLRLLLFVIIILFWGNPTFLTPRTTIEAGPFYEMGKLGNANLYKYAF